MKFRKLIIVMVVLMMTVSSLLAQTFSSGSTGADGDLTCSSGDYLIDMSDHPDGIYNYGTILIDTDAVVKFVANQKNRPVVWLAQGDVTIKGMIDISGEDGYQGKLIAAKPGPGGWPGAEPDGSSPFNVGLGPGGGTRHPSVIKANHSYGNIFCIPLTGGSGGSDLEWGTSPSPGGGGGGAILIASSGRITIEGAGKGINASGGTCTYNGGGCDWRGSGGMIRLVANGLTISNESLLTVGSDGDVAQPTGFIRLEAYDFQISNSADLKGTITRGNPNALFSLPPNTPTLKVKSIGGVTIGSDPGGSAYYPDADLPSGIPNPTEIVVEGTGLDDGTSITVTIHCSFATEIKTYDARLSGNKTLTTATINADLTAGVGTIYARTK